MGNSHRGSSFFRPEFGLELSRLAGLKTGTIYPALARLEQAGWLTTHWQTDEEAMREQRPRRRLYELTTKGTERAREEFAALAPDLDGVGQAKSRHRRDAPEAT